MVQSQHPQGHIRQYQHDLPQHARERLAEMRQHHFFTSDLSVNEFLLVKEAGFDPLGLVMGSSIYQIAPTIPRLPPEQPGCELTAMTHALYHARELAMNRMEEEADELGADGIVGVRLHVRMHAFAPDIMEFIAIGTAIRHEHGEHYKNAKGMPFTSDLSGQDFVMLLRAGYRPVTLALGNCTYEINPQALQRYAMTWSNVEMTEYTQAYMEARETAMERMVHDLFHDHPAGTADAPVGIVGMRVEEMARVGYFQTVEYTAIGTAIAPLEESDPRRDKTGLPAPFIVVPLDR